MTDLEIIMTDEVKEQMENDKDLAEALRGLMAAMRQAKHSVDTGQHETFDEALEAITGGTVSNLDEDDNPL